MRGKLSKMSHITMEVLVIDVHGESAVDFHGEFDLLLVSQVSAGERKAEQDVLHHHQCIIDVH